MNGLLSHKGVSACWQGSRRSTRLQTGISGQELLRPECPWTVTPRTSDGPGMTHKASEVVGELAAALPSQEAPRSQKSSCSPFRLLSDMHISVAITSRTLQKKNYI